MAEPKRKRTAAKTAKPKVTRKRKRITLEFQTEPGHDVYVAGSFNDWKPEQKKMKEETEGHYTITMMLPAGEYEYKIINNGRWIPDPNAAKWSPNPFGSFNSILKVDL